VPGVASAKPDLPAHWRASRQWHPSRTSLLGEALDILRLLATDELGAAMKKLDAAGSNPTSDGGSGPTLRDGTAARCRELAMLFLKLGTLGFGGPAAHIALMEDEVVRRRGWLTPQDFLDLIAACNLIPGPNSTEMAIHIGYRRAGWLGLLIAGTCFALPAILIVLGLAWLYVRFGHVPAMEGLLGGVKPAIVAVIAQALWRLGRTAVKSRSLAFVGLMALSLSFLGVHELVVLFGAGAMASAGKIAERVSRPRSGSTLPCLALGPLAPATATAALGGAASGAAGGLWPIFAFFLKVGCVWFGSGYVLLAFLRADLVERWGWVSEGQLLDAIAVGQVTPGPLFTTATFIGYVLCGFPGAMVATGGIFLPALLFVAISAPFVPRLRNSLVLARLLDGLNVGALALMVAVTWYLGRAAIVGWPGLLVAGASLLLLVRYRVNSTWIVLGGALVGLVCFWVWTSIEWRRTGTTGRS
jgi:chromate transporter